MAARQEDADGRCIYDEVGWSAVDLMQLCVERLLILAENERDAAVRPRAP